MLIEILAVTACVYVIVKCITRMVGTFTNKDKK